MDSFLGPLLFLMMFLAPVQLILTLVMIVVTKNQTQRKHFLYYLAGVVGYSVVLSALVSLTANPTAEPLLLTFFFCGALSLALYNFLILVSPNLFR